MTSFDLENLDSGTWFTYCNSKIDEKSGDVKFDEPLDSAGRICIRQADFETLENIEKIAGGKLKREFVLNPNSKAMELVEYRDRSIDEKRKDREMLWDHVICDWEGLKDKNGNDIPVTLENKMKLIQIPAFFRFIQHCLDIFNGQAEVTEKN